MKTEDMYDSERVKLCMYTFQTINTPFRSIFDNNNHIELLHGCPQLAACFIG